ncbi:MAG: hypothetical protein ABI555_06580 [Chloroflexota bacterium]
MIDVLILGQPNWGSHIANALNEHSIDVRARFIPERSYARLLGSRPRSRRCIIMRAGYRIGGTTVRGRLFDAYWALLRRSLPDAVPCHYWLGTDVLDTLLEAQAGTLRSRALASTRDELHIAAAPWLVPELESVGLQVTMAYVPGKFNIPDDVAPLPAAFSVLTYLPPRRFEFYGGAIMLEVAHRLPDIQFDIVGNTGDGMPLAPSNVRWHGWVADMIEAYANTTLVVRIPRHDAGGGSMVEGLFNARHVVYTYDVPFVCRVQPVTPETVADAVATYHEAHAAGRLGLNLAGRAYALQEYDEVKRAERVLTLLRAHA